MGKGNEGRTRQTASSGTKEFLLEQRNAEAAHGRAEPCRQPALLRHQWYLREHPGAWTAKAGWWPAPQAEAMPSTSRSPAWATPAPRRALSTSCGQVAATLPVLCCVQQLSPRPRLPPVSVCPSEAPFPHWFIHCLSCPPHPSGLLCTANLPSACSGCSAGSDMLPAWLIGVGWRVGDRAE